jgi:hypothetical protein
LSKVKFIYTCTLLGVIILFFPSKLLRILFFALYLVIISTILCVQQMKLNNLIFKSTLLMLNIILSQFILKHFPFMHHLQHFIYINNILPLNICFRKKKIGATSSALPSAHHLRRPYTKNRLNIMASEDLCCTIGVQCLPFDF